MLVCVCVGANVRVMYRNLCCSAENPTNSVGVGIPNEILFLGRLWAVLNMNINIFPEFFQLLSHLTRQMDQYFCDITLTES